MLRNMDRVNTIGIYFTSRIPLSRNGMVNEISIGILQHVPLRNYVMKRGKIRMERMTRRRIFRERFSVGLNNG